MPESIFQIFLNSMDAGLVGGIAGSVVGLMGGLLGAYFSVKSAQSKIERVFVMQAAALCGFLVLLFVTGFLILGPTKGAILWIPYGFFLPLGIVYINRKIKNIRESSSGHSST